jgi:glycosidase
MTFMQLTLPGALSLYYGQELGMQDVNGDQHAVMQWKPKGDDHHGFRLVPDSEQKMVLVFNETSGDSAENFEDQYALPNSPLKVYRNLAKLRQRDEALIVGETVRDVLDGDIVLFSRYVKNNGTSTGSVFVVALNFGEDEKSVNLFDHKDLLPTNKDLAKGEISAVTTGVSHMRARDKADLSATALTIPSKQGVLVKF